MNLMIVVPILTLIASTIEKVVQMYKDLGHDEIKKDEVRETVMNILTGIELFRKGTSDYSAIIFDVVDRGIEFAVAAYNSKSFWSEKWVLDKMPPDGIDVK